MTVTSKPVVLLLGQLDHEPSREVWRRTIEPLAEVITPISTSRSSFIAECSSPRLSRILIAFRTFNSASITGPLDRDLINSLPLSLKYICHNGAGYDQIDIAACTARNIQVSNVVDATNAATADTALFLLLGALRNYNQGMAELRRGGWVGENVSLGSDPEGKVLGIVGLGAIGRELKRRTDVLGMKTIYYNRKRLGEELEDGAEYVGSLDGLLGAADVISLNLPLNPQTHRVISTAQFEKMKDGVIIVNTARGGVIDEDALVKALDSGKVRTVGLDVYEDEPRVHEGLRRNERCVLVPHMGTYTAETQTKMECWCISNVEHVLKGKGLRSIVPEQKGVKFD